MALQYCYLKQKEKVFRNPKPNMQKPNNNIKRENSFYALINRSAAMLNLCKFYGSHNIHKLRLALAVS